MIHVDRTAEPRPGDLDIEDKNHTTEAQRAEAYFTCDPRPADSFTFAAYRREGVSKALNRLFNYKCAYCESRYRCMGPVDIEHFRPKGRVLVSTDPRTFKDGYWWLASEWSNLLASCIDCNRARWHQIDDDGAEEKFGKADQFPLLDENYRAGGVGHEQAEQPLLLNPCECEPVDYLSFDHVEGESIVSPAHPDETSYEHARARRSIDVFGLNRPGLVEERTERLDRARAHLQSIRNLQAIQAAAPGARDAVRPAIKDELAAIRAYITRRAPWSAAIRAYVVPELQALGIEVGDLAD